MCVNPRRRCGCVVIRVCVCTGVAELVVEVKSLIEWVDVRVLVPLGCMLS